jgi:alkaline phosphatase D
MNCLVLTGLVVSSASAIGAELAAGPMVGPTAMRAAAIWVQGKEPARARVVFWPKEQPGNKRVSGTARLVRDSDFVAHIEVSGLEPGVRYAYKVLLDGKPTAATYEFATQKLWQWRTDPPNFKLLLGSCAYINEPTYDRPGKPYGGDTAIFRTMAQAKPDLTLWLGDNVYYREVDYDSPSGMAARWRHDRKTPDLQPLLATGTHAAIWDDHDYGPNDANASFALKDHALQLFKRYWANPSHGLPGSPGVFTSFRHGDAEFFLLDNRWYRDDDKLMDENKAMFGEQQMRWLMNALVNSTATFKFIAAGSQMLDRSSPFEGWRHFDVERQRFIGWLTRQGVNGVFFLSGDRHRTELLRWERPNAYPLYELTCSPLTSGSYALSKIPPDPGLVEGTRVGEQNFCALDITGPRNKRILTARSFAADGRELWRKEISAADLMHP